MKKLKKSLAERIKEEMVIQLPKDKIKEFQEIMKELSHSQLKPKFDAMSYDELYDYVLKKFYNEIIGKKEG